MCVCVCYLPSQNICYIALILRRHRHVIWFLLSDLSAPIFSQRSLVFETVTLRRSFVSLFLFYHHFSLF